MIRSSRDLHDLLRRLDGRGYKAYKDLGGTYDLDGITLHVDHVQGDPFAAPSRMRLVVPASRARIPTWALSSAPRRVALRDFMARAFCREADRRSRGGSGSGKSGMVAMDRPGQEILDRTAVMLVGGAPAEPRADRFGSEAVEGRITVGLPAFGRRIAGRQAAALLLEELPRLVEGSLVTSALDLDALMTHVTMAEDARALRDQLDGRGLVAFVADGAVLPRASGVDPRPLCGAGVVPYASPDSLRVTLEAPTRGPVTGMGIPRGVTLVVGGGYHGKSTLLSALEAGVYDHVPGDGRELVVTVPDAVKIRAEDGRRVEKVDISPFISGLPGGKETERFSSDDASGSTSQAAAIMEHLEVGATVLLVDEDTSATNFMIRDQRMQALVAKEHEPITPFVDKVRQLSHDLGVSTVLVVGGSGDYFDVADKVVGMVEYLPRDVTEEAREVAARFATARKHEGGDSFGRVTPRIPLGASLDPRKGKRPVSVKPRGRHTLAFGEEHIDLDALSQLVDTSQTRAIGEAIAHARHLMDGTRSLAEVIDLLFDEVTHEGLDALTRWPMGDLARFRKHELAAAINRLRTLAVR